MECPYRGRGSDELCSEIKSAQVLLEERIGYFAGDGIIKPISEAYCSHTLDIADGGYMNCKAYQKLSGNKPTK